MTISKKKYQQAFIWIWLPGEVNPVIAGKIEAIDGSYLFNYGKSYLERIHDSNQVIPIYDKELPLKPGRLPLLSGLTMPGCIRDAAPDAWGRRVILNRLIGSEASKGDTNELDELAYCLESGSDRIGALDFQRSPTAFIPRYAKNPSLEDLLNSVERVEKGIPLEKELDQALFHGSSIGGARPKALIEDQDTKYIAKFSSSTDIYSVVKAEYVAMRLAKKVGLNVAPVKIEKVANKDVLLISRFDRVRQNNSWSRICMVSALTLFGLDEMMARYASYEDFAEIIRHYFENPKSTLKELFSRLVFNILCSNTDDHARNHAALWDGKILKLTPAYDICPQPRAGNEASQAMLISGNNNLSQFKYCLETAHNFQLSKEKAISIFEEQKKIITNNWDSICEEANLSNVDRHLLWNRQFLNPFSIEY